MRSSRGKKGQLEEKEMKTNYFTEIKDHKITEILGKILRFRETKIHSLFKICAAEKARQLPSSVAARVMVLSYKSKIYI